MYIYIYILRIDWVPINECDDLVTMTHFCRASLIFGLPSLDCQPLEMTCPAPSVDEHYQFKICHQYATNGLPQNSWTADCFPTYWKNRLEPHMTSWYPGEHENSWQMDVHSQET